MDAASIQAPVASGPFQRSFHTEMSKLIESHDWVGTPVGPRARWSRSLRSALDMMLPAGYPMLIAWGRECTVFYNDAFRLILGATKHPHALGQSLQTTFSEAWHLMGPATEQVLRSGETIVRQDQLTPMHRNGYLEECYFDLSYSPIRDESGAVGGILIIAQETTTRMLNERRLRALHEWGVSAKEAKSPESACEIAARLLQQCSPDLPMLRIYLLSEGAKRAKLAGAAGMLEEFPPLSEPLALRNDNGDEYLQAMSRLSYGCPFELTLVPITSGIPIAPYMAMLPLTRKGQTQPEGILIAGLNPCRALDQDYTSFLELVATQLANEVAAASAYAEERVRADQLAESEQHFHTIADTVPVLLWMSDVNGSCTYVNQFWTDFTGQKQSQALDGGWQQTVHPDDAKWSLDESRTAMRERRRYWQEYRLRGKDGEYRWVLDAGVPRFSPDGSFLGYIGSCVDITNQKKLEETLRLQTEELVRSNQDLEQFAFVASHDLKEPLRNVSAYVQLLQRRYKGKLDEDADTFIGFAVAGVDRMQSLINDLLSYSRAVNSRQINREMTPITALVQWAMMNLQTAIRESDAVITHDPLPTLEVDQNRLVHVFQNLIGNALKYRSDAQPQIHISATEQDDGWVFGVKDNGIGIDPQYYEKIFGIFQRLHGREYPGNGIGLAVCRKILEGQGGRLWVESTPGVGSTFYFKLPRE